MINSERLTIIAFVAILVTTCSYGLSYALATRECLLLGWPNAKVDITLTQYCIKRIDQTDVVQPLKSLRNMEPMTR